MKKKLIISIGIIVIGIVIAYNYIYQDHRDIAKEKATFKLEATDLIKQFQENTSTSQKKYLDQTIEVSGKVTAVDSNFITLNNSVFCSMADSIKITINSDCSIKGRFIGYDDLLEEIKLDQCTLTN